jgi:hypothetical protein
VESCFAATNFSRDPGSHEDGWVGIQADGAIRALKGSCILYQVTLKVTRHPGLKRWRHTRKEMMNMAAMQLDETERRSFWRTLRNVANVLRTCCAAASGRTALEPVRIPDGIANVSARSRRLVRQAQISPW